MYGVPVFGATAGLGRVDPARSALAGSLGWTSGTAVSRATVVGALQVRPASVEVTIA
ncbi:hypothetical protein ACIOG8_30960 [Streptomyces erythrochromogenes]|uniref:hypothetical protein n=1 Tax=Streptomyces erythrochromogenes TaxID=285574 RepID=UPI003827F420